MDCLSSFDTDEPERSIKKVAAAKPATSSMTDVAFEAPSVAASELITPKICKQAATIKTKSTAMMAIFIGFISS